MSRIHTGVERDHGQGALRTKQRPYPTRGFKQAAAADILTRGPGFIQNLRNGFARRAPKLTADVPSPLRLMTA